MKLSWAGFYAYAASKLPERREDPFWNIRHRMKPFTSKRWMTARLKEYIELCGYKELAKKIE